MRSILVLTLFVFALAFPSEAVCSETFLDITLPSGLGSLTCMTTQGTSIFCGTTAGFARYDTDSKQWTVAKKPVDAVHVSAVAASATDCMLVTSDGTLYYSYNRGADWFQVYGMEHFQVATTVACINGTYHVGAANGAFTVNAMQQSIVKLCPNYITGSVVSIAGDGNALLVVQNGQQGLQVIMDDGLSCKDVTSSSDIPIIPVQGSFFGGVPVLLDATRLFEWDQTSQRWQSIITFDTQTSATFINIQPSRPNAVIGFDSFIQLLDFEDQTIVGPTQIPGLSIHPNSFIPGGFIGDDWVGGSTSNPFISAERIGDLIERFRNTETAFYVELVDVTGALLRNVPYSMYALDSANCNSRRLIKTGVADANGRIENLFLSQLGVDSTTMVEFEVVVRVETTDKLDRPTGFDTLFVQTIGSRVGTSNGDFFQYRIGGLRNQRVMLPWTMTAFRLVVSVEWDATTEYIDSLTQWLAATSNLLLDATDGQIYVDRFIVFDNKDRWGAKDIAVEVSNTVWPHVNLAGGFWRGRYEQWINYAVYMPRAFYGNDSTNRFRSAQPDWLTTMGPDFWATVTHEIGHHVLEFIDEYSGPNVFRNWEFDNMRNRGRVFGIMHSSWFFRDGAEADRLASELSADARVWSTGEAGLYSHTWQYFLRRNPCWEMLRTNYSRTQTINGTTVRAQIVRPVDRPRAPGDSIIIGPRDFVTNQRSCLYRPEPLIINATRRVSERMVQLRIMNGSGVGADNLDVDLLRSRADRSRINYQGRTGSDGRFIALGVSTGNVIRVHGVPWGSSVRSGGTIPLNTWDHEVLPGSIDKDVPTVQNLETISGTLQTADILSRMVYTLGNVKNQSVTLTTHLQNGETTSYTKSQTDEAITFDVPVETTSGMTDLPVRVAYMSASDLATTYSPQGDVQIFADSAAKNSASYLVIGSGFVPPVFTGIAEGEELLSNIVSFAADGDLSGIRTLQLLLWHEPDKGKFATVHKWDEQTRAWKPISSYPISSPPSVFAGFDGPGTYAVFSTPDQTSTVESALAHGVKVYPNPAQQSLHVTVPEGAILHGMRDIIGRNVAARVVENGQTHTFDVSSLVNGLYFVTLQIGTKNVSVPVVIQR